MSAVLVLWWDAQRFSDLIARRRSIMPSVWWPYQVSAAAPEGCGSGERSGSCCPACSTRGCLCSPHTSRAAAPWSTRTRRRSPTRTMQRTRTTRTCKEYPSRRRLRRPRAPPLPQRYIRHLQSIQRNFKACSLLTSNCIIEFFLKQLRWKWRNSVWKWNNET